MTDPKTDTKTDDKTDAKPAKVESGTPFSTFAEAEAAAGKGQHAEPRGVAAVVVDDE